MPMSMATKCRSRDGLRSKSAGDNQRQKMPFSLARAI